MKKPKDELKKRVWKYQDFHKFTDEKNTIIPKIFNEIERRARQQTAQEIFDEIDYAYIIEKEGFRRKEYNKIKQKYLKGDEE